MKRPVLSPLPALALVLAVQAAPHAASRADETALRVPASEWLRYADPEAAGWSEEKLAEARTYWESIDSAAWMVVEDGVVVVAWGDVERRYMCHSVRKSFMSGLYGLYVDAGTIDTEKTLAELGIDDEPELTEVEQRARIEDLLRARSGVFKLAAYEPPQNPKPERGAYEPGEYWCYNNFDFNTLCTIFEQETGKRVFEEFDERFAQPLGMQDYRVRDGYYHYELDKSIHPAYPFRLSARDSARYGLLYLNGGAWGEQRILSEEWIERSTRSYSDTGTPGGGYGYMWWLFDDAQTPGLSGYTALGVGGQAIVVLPEAGLVVVNRTDTYSDRRVSDEQRNGLIRLVLAARGEAPDAEPELVPLGSPATPRPKQAAGEFESYLGTYSLGGREARLGDEDGGLRLEVHNAGVFGVVPVPSSETPGDSGQSFFIEDIELYMAISRPAEGGEGVAESEFELRNEVAGRLEAGELEGAYVAAERALELFPMSPTAHVMLARVVADTGDTEFAASLVEAALEIDPEHGEARLLARDLSR